jgi:hypothetical protein
MHPNFELFTRKVTKEASRAKKAQGTKGGRGEFSVASTIPLVVRYDPPLEVTLLIFLL